jgi:hypothetical protein
MCRHLAGSPQLIMSYVYDILRALFSYVKVYSMVYDIVEDRRTWTALWTKCLDLSPVIKLLRKSNEEGSWFT